MDAKTVVAVCAIVVGIGMAVFGGLAGIIWKMLNDKIDKVEEHSKAEDVRIAEQSKLEDKRIAENVHDLRDDISPWRLDIEKAIERIKEHLGMR